MIYRTATPRYIVGRRHSSSSASAGAKCEHVAMPWRASQLAGSSSATSIAAPINTGSSSTTTSSSSQRPRSTMLRPMRATLAARRRLGLRQGRPPHVLGGLFRWRSNQPLPATGAAGAIQRQALIDPSRYGPSARRKFPLDDLWD